uniref:(northern house mosquito) hypothetical protein n=1 Tax=Culex pipiens TaxID=7175 RepID=A0A8D8FHY0_CULPI
MFGRFLLLLLLLLPGQNFLAVLWQRFNHVVVMSAVHSVSAIFRLRRQDVFRVDDSAAADDFGLVAVVEFDVLFQQQRVLPAKRRRGLDLLGHRGRHSESGSINLRLLRNQRAVGVRTHHRTQY